MWAFWSSGGSGYSRHPDRIITRAAEFAFLHVCACVRQSSRSQLLILPGILVASRWALSGSSSSEHYLVLDLFLFLGGDDVLALLSAYSYLQRSLLP